MIQRFFLRGASVLSKQSKNNLFISQSYKFCTQLEKPNQVKQKLLKVIEKESKHELENYQTDETALEYLNKVGFELIESETSNVIELRKKVGENLVTVSFTSRSPNQDEGEQEQEQQTQEGQEQQQEYQDYSDFTVYIQRPDGKAMVYECQSVQSELQVSMVTVVSDVEAHKNTPRYERGLIGYEGPEFSTLDERLQSTFIQYLKSIGVNEEVSAFVEHYSLDKEQRLYMQWLSRISDFLKKE